jgi:hypothetical protein
MKRNLLIALFVLCCASFAVAQNTWSPSTDVLGAHLNYGRGCAGCHAPHSGAYGNGAAKTADPTSGNVALWGEDVGSLYGQTITSGGGGYVEILPTSMTNTSDVSGMLTCLSCHDGNYAKGAMMKNAIYESVAGIAGYGTYNTIPTLLGNDGTSVGNYLNDHPVGNNAIIGCGGQYNWDCTITNGKINVPSGTNFAKFITNYGFFVSPGVNSTPAPIVVCTTCHNQHLMNVVKVTNGASSGLATGYYQTMFFVRAPYNPGSTTAGSNETAQFCRQCHGGEANESNNGTAGTTF